MASLQLHVTLGALLFLGLAGCGGDDAKPAPGSTGAGARETASEDERGSVGVPPPAVEYCVKLGYTLTQTGCTFPDGTSCEPWAFYRGQCGQSHSYCSRQGGTLSTKTEDKGGWTAVYGVCTLNGKVCEEGLFLKTGKCE
jgi:putative hemolysin